MKSLSKLSVFIIAAFLQVQCKTEPKKQTGREDMITEIKHDILKEGRIEAMDNAFWKIVAREAKLEILASGHEWTEGPLWVAEDSMLLYTDIPRNAIYKWKEGSGTSVYLQPSGFLGEDFKGPEPGANGLLLDQEGHLVLCQHGERQIARMKNPLNRPAPDFDILADSYKDMRLNSPNDAVFKSNGDLYFTDPPYGLPGQMEDPGKEIPFQGVYRLDSDGQVDLLTNEFTRPNGIAFSPDESLLYVANSDPDKAIWKVFDILDDGMLSNGRTFHDATDNVPGNKGLPDGLKVHSSGTIFATGPGGVWVFSPEGSILGLIHTGQATSNCAMDTDENYLFITADSYLLRLALN